MPHIVTKQIILETQHIVVISQDFPSDTIFITFNEMAMTAGGNVFWGDGFFLKQQIAAIGIVSVTPNWYPKDDMAIALREINALTHGRRVVTYGFSQGAYGALKFSRGLRAHASIAFSPQFSIDPADVGEFDRRFLSHHSRELHNGSAITGEDLCGKNYIFVDPLCKVDALNCLKIRKLASAQGAEIELIPVPFTEHGTVRIVSDGKIGSKLVRSFMQDAHPEKYALRSLIRNARQLSIRYQEGRFLYLLSRKRSSTRFLSRAVESAPAVKKALWLTCVHVVTGAFDDAAALLATIPDSGLGDLPVYPLWNLFRAYKFHLGELRLAAALRTIAPNDAFARLHSVNSYISHGELKNAREELESIVLLGNAPEQVNFIIDFAKKLRNTLVMQALLERSRVDAKKEEIIRLELAEMHADLRDDKSVMKALRPLGDGRTLSQPSIKRILERIAKMDDRNLARRFSYKYFTLTENDREYLHICQIGQLVRRNPSTARVELREIQQSLSATYNHWRLCAQHLYALGDVYDAAGAQRRAVRLASATDVPESRLWLARLYMRLGESFRARLQLLVVYFRCAKDPEALRVGRDFATEWSFYWIALLFASRFYRCRPIDLDALVHLCFLRLKCGMAGSRKSIGLAASLRKGIGAGRDITEQSWTLLVEILLKNECRDDADYFLKEGIRKFPNSKRLLQIKSAGEFVTKFQSRHTAA